MRGKDTEIMRAYMFSEGIVFADGVDAALELLREEGYNESVREMALKETDEIYFIDENTYYDEIPEDEEDEYINGYKITDTLTTYTNRVKKPHVLLD